MALMTLPNGRTVNIPGGGIMSPAVRAQIFGQQTAPPTTAYGAQQPAAQPAANAYWQPSFLQTPRVPYPQSPYAGYGNTTGGRSGGGGGYGGGGGISIPQANAYNPTMFQGPGAYWPGHQAEFQGQQQVASMLVAQGYLQPDSRQPAQMAASLAAARNSYNPNARRMAGGSGSPFGINGGGGRGYGSSGGIAGDFQSGMDDARQANEARYRDILEGYDSRMGYLQGAGAQEYADINEAYDAQKASGLQSLTGRGLGNSTIVNTMGMGYDRERSNSIGRLEERLRNQYMDTQKDTLDFMERRTDQPPDLGLLNQIGQLQGQSGSGVPQAYQVSMSSVPMGGGYYPVSYNVPSSGGGVGAQTAQQMAAIRARALAANAAKQQKQQAPPPLRNPGMFVDPYQFDRVSGIA